MGAFDRLGTILEAIGLVSVIMIMWFVSAPYTKLIVVKLTDVATSMSVSLSPIATGLIILGHIINWWGPFLCIAVFGGWALVSSYSSDPNSEPYY